MRSADKAFGVAHSQLGLLDLSGAQQVRLQGEVQEAVASFRHTRILATQHSIHASAGGRRRPARLGCCCSLSSLRFHQSLCSHCSLALCLRPQRALRTKSGHRPVSLFLQLLSDAFKHTDHLQGRTMVLRCGADERVSSLGGTGRDWNAHSCHGIANCRPKRNNRERRSSAAFPPAACGRQRLPSARQSMAPHAGAGALARYTQWGAPPVGRPIVLVLRSTTPAGTRRKDTLGGVRITATGKAAARRGCACRHPAAAERSHWGGSTCAHLAAQRTPQTLVKPRRLLLKHESGEFKPLRVHSRHSSTYSTGCAVPTGRQGNTARPP